MSRNKVDPFLMKPITRKAIGYMGASAEFLFGDAGASGRKKFPIIMYRVGEYFAHGVLVNKYLQGVQELFELIH